MKLDNLEGHEHNLMFFGNTKNFKFSKKKKFKTFRTLYQRNRDSIPLDFFLLEEISEPHFILKCTTYNLI